MVVKWVQTGHSRYDWCKR